MKAYLITTGTVFGLLAVLHAWRVVAESTDMARDPFFVGITIVAAGFCVWAFYLLRIHGLTRITPSDETR